MTVSVKDRTATLYVDVASCRLEDLVRAAEDLGYAVTVRSIEPFRVTEPVSENSRRSSRGRTRVGQSDAAAADHAASGQGGDQLGDGFGRRTGRFHVDDLQGFVTVQRGQAGI